MSRSEPAVCLAVRDYSETSQIVHFLTPGDGVVRLMAKGTKRKKSKSGGAVDLFSEGIAVYTRKNPDTLGNLLEFSETVSHTALRADTARLNTALYALELAGKLVPEGDPHPRVFTLLSNALSRLGDDDAPLLSVLAYFQKQVLVRVGLLGEIEKCTGCLKDLCAAGTESPGGVYYSQREGGLLCAACGAGTGEKMRVDRAALVGLEAIRAAESGRNPGMDAKTARAAVRFLDNIVAGILSRPLRMSRYLDDTRGYNSGDARNSSE